MASPLDKTTEVYAIHGIPLECDVYQASDYSNTTPALLYFHAGGLVGWSRECVPPWLVQACYQRKWPLVSASYRLLPQAGGKGLLEDASAAYNFTMGWKASNDRRRKVIVAGSSGGVFLAALIPHHCQPAPLALLSIEGINTFRHPFFNSSTLLTPEPIPYSEVKAAIEGPVMVGKKRKGYTVNFALDKLLPDGSKNRDWVPPPTPVGDDDDNDNDKRGMLYDYYTYENSWLDLVGDVDPGYEWARDEAAATRVAAWPPTLVFHGDEDCDVAIGVSEQMRDMLGEDKVCLLVAPGQPHLYELGYFLEDEEPGMDVVREAIKCLDNIVKVAS